MPKKRWFQTAILVLSLGVLLFKCVVVIPASGVGDIEDEVQSSGPETVSNLILLMLDGVRWQEVVGTHRRARQYFLTSIRPCRAEAVYLSTIGCRIHTE